MATKQTETTRAALARIQAWRTAILSAAVVLLVCLQRPLGIGADGIATVQGIVFASLLMDLPIARFYFPRPRFPRKRGKGNCSTGRGGRGRCGCGAGRE